MGTLMEFFCGSLLAKAFCFQTFILGRYSLEVSNLIITTTIRFLQYSSKKIELWVKFDHATTKKNSMCWGKNGETFMTRSKDGFEGRLCSGNVFESQSWHTWRQSWCWNRPRFALACERKSKRSAQRIASASTFYQVFFSFFTFVRFFILSSALLLFLLFFSGINRWNDVSLVCCLPEGVIL